MTTVGARRAPDFWQAQRVVVTGGAGFLGSYVVERLRARGAVEVMVPRSREFDLVREADVERLYRETHPTLLIHLAAIVGGIGANQRHPAEFFYKNLMMGAYLMEQGRRSGVGKFVAVGTVCSYPKHTPVPFRESDFWNGYPEETNAPYGLAKKMLAVQAQAYRAEYGFNAINPILANLYGPGDNVDPATSHVIPALIRKCLEAKRAGAAEIEVWGSGTATREFLYVEDAAEAVCLAAERHDDPEPVNVGSGSEVSIKNLVDLVKDATGYVGGIRWDASKPDGQPRRSLDTSKAARAFGFSATTPLAAGLARTVQWYRTRI